MKKSLQFSILCSLFFVLSSQAETTTCIVQTPTIVGSSLVCGSGTSTVSLVGENTQLWYAESVGGVAFATSTGTSFITGILSANTNYWVTGLKGSCESQRVWVEIKKVEKPSTPAFKAANLPCGSGKAQVMVTSEFDNIWYASSVGGIVLDTVPILQIPTLTGTTSYWVTNYNHNEGCESDRAEIVVTPNVIPEKPTFETKVFNEASADLYYGEYKFLNPSYFVSVELKNGKIIFPGIPYSNSHIYTVAGFNNTFLVVNWNRNTIGEIKLINKSRQGCNSEATVYSFTIPGVATGFDENLEIKESIYIFPNPSNGNFEVRSSLITEKLELTDILGMSEILINPTQSINTKLKGIISVKFWTKGRFFVKKLLIE